jgi:hypothetical protein
MRGKEKSTSIGHWQCEKEMDDHLRWDRRLKSLEEYTSNNNRNTYFSYSYLTK